MMQVGFGCGEIGIACLRWWNFRSNPGTHWDDVLRVESQRRSTEKNRDPKYDLSRDDLDIPVIIAVTFHEAAHGFVAHLLATRLLGSSAGLVSIPLSISTPLGRSCCPASCYWRIRHFCSAMPSRCQSIFGRYAGREPVWCWSPPPDPPLILGSPSWPVCRSISSNTYLELSRNGLPRI